jgi:serine protease Do
MFNIGWMISRAAVLLLTATLLVTYSPAPAAAEPQAINPKDVIGALDQAYVENAKEVSPAVVRVSSVQSTPISSDQGMEPFFKEFPFFFPPFGQQLPKQFQQHPRSVEVLMGSGFIVRPDGLIVTNNHVVKNMKDIKVTLPGNQEYKAKLIAADAESDVALIKIDAKDLPTLKWGDSSKLKVGEIVFAVGNPFGLRGTVTRGIVSATGRTNVGIIGYEDFIQTDAPINPGNSGGPLVNIDGEVVGINTAIASKSGGYMGIGFAIPSNSARLVMEELLKTGKVERGLLGVNIQDLTEALAKSFGRTTTSGALVSQVVPGGPAAKAGVKAGDIILSYNGQQVMSASQLKVLVGQTKPDSTAKLGIWRDKKTVELSVSIGERTAKALEAAVPTGAASSELGIKVEKVPSQLASKMGLKEGLGVVITHVSPSGKGSAMGLRDGDVILEVDGKMIKGVSELNKEVTASKKNGIIRMMIQRGSATIYLAETF